MNLVPNRWMAQRPNRGERHSMNRFMVIKIMKDGTQKAEFLDNEEDVKGYTIGLRSIDRAYIVFEWSKVHRAYVQVIAWDPEGVV